MASRLTRLAVALLVVSFLGEAASALAQITSTDTENQSGTTLAVISQAGLGNPKQELIALYGAQTRALTALTNLLGQSGLPWQIADLASQLAQLDKEIAASDAVIVTLGGDIVKIQARISALDPADPTTPPNRPNCRQPWRRSRRNKPGSRPNAPSWRCSGTRFSYNSPRWGRHRFRSMRK